MQKYEVRIWRDGPAVKSKHGSQKDVSSVPSICIRQLTTAGTPAPGHSVPSSGAQNIN